jgi:tetratricopeptide (TPR) repeat protein
MAEKRITRKELLKSPDEFLTLTERTINFVNTHSRQVYIGLTALVCILVVGLLANWYLSHKENQALTAYGQALDSVDLGAKPTPEQIGKAVQALEAVRKDYPASPPAHNALINLGQLYYQAGQYDQSISSYQQFLKELKPWEETIKPIIQDSLADVYEAHGQNELAAQIWEDLAKTEGGMLKSQAYRGLGRVYLSMGKLDQAQKAYDSYLAEFPNSVDAAQVKARLAAISQ